MCLEIYVTNEGSSTILNRTLDETYHSKIGALQEAEHIFIEMGLNFIIDEKIDKIKVFEVGFGTGLNAWKTCIWASQQQIQVDYLSIDNHPLPMSIIEQLNYKTFSKDETHHHWFDAIERSQWNEWSNIHPYFSLHKWKGDLINTSLEKYKNTFDICFFDAFSPNKQPDIWRENTLRGIYNVLKINGIMTTYCSQGQFRRTLKSLGFMVNKCIGPSGKREMTRARKI